jgi:hypothetical protein
MEQTTRLEGIEASTTDALNKVMPWRFNTAPHNGESELYTGKIESFSCPSSEFGNRAGHYSSSTLPWVQNQQVLHYRAVGGAPPLQPGPHSAHAPWADNGIVYPLSKVRLTDILDGTSNTLMIGEYSSAVGFTGSNKAPSSAWGAIQPWTWGYYNYNPPVSSGGWLMIDHKYIQYPIGYSGSFLTNNSPYRSNHPGMGADFAMGDGSVRFLNSNTSLQLLQSLATRKGSEAVSTSGI